MNVDEEAQDAGAVRRAIGARVDVDELVARPRLQLAALLLDRAKARRAKRPAVDEIGARAAQERFDPPPVQPQNFLHAARHLGCSLEARNRIGFRVIADVLHLQLAR
jgi:hypothetical protein